jgi:DNA polymerase III subunit delta'
MVEEVRERVIRAASYRPFESEKRVFVIEASEQMRDESQNALLKTLEEPPDFVHLILLTAEPSMLLETIASRCQPIDFAPLPPEAVEAQLSGAGSPDELAAAARLSAGDVVRAQYLLSDSGKMLRAAALALGKAVGGDSPDTERDAPAAIAEAPADPRGVASGESPPTASSPPWRALLDAAEKAGEEAEATTREMLEEEAEAGIKRSAKDLSDEAKRAGRRRRTEILDLGLELSASWFRDLAAAASGAVEVAYSQDRLAELERAATRDPSRPRRAAELVQDTRRRLDLNVSEELALEALAFRLERVFA